MSILSIILLIAIILKKTKVLKNIKIKQETIRVTKEDIKTDENDKTIKKAYINGKWRMVDKKGNVDKLSFDTISPFNEDYAVVSKDKKFGFINKDGKIVIPLKYDDAQSFTSGYAVIKKNGKYGAIDKSGKERIKPDYYDEIISFDGEGIARAKNIKDNKDLAIDINNNIIKDFNSKD